MNLKTLKRKLKFKNLNKVFLKPMLLISHTRPLSGEEESLLLKEVVLRDFDSLKISPRILKLSFQKKFLNMTILSSNACRIYYFNLNVDKNNFISMLKFLELDESVTVLSFYLFNTFFNTSRFTAIFLFLFTFGFQITLTNFFFKVIRLPSLVCWNKESSPYITTSVIDEVDIGSLSVTGNQFGPSRLKNGLNLEKKDYHC